MDAKLHPLHAVIFDLDGTLIDSAPDILGCLEKAVEHFQLSPVLKPDMSCIGPPLQDILRNMVPSLVGEDVDRIVNYFRQQYLDSGFRNTHPYAGVMDMLQVLQSNDIDCFVATNKPRMQTEAVLEKTRLSGFFRDYRCLGDNSAKTKQDLIQSLATSHRLNVGSCIVIGDGCSDIQAAKTHGMYSIAHLGGYGQSHDLLACQPDAVIETMADALAGIQRRQTHLC